VHIWYKNGKEHDMLVHITEEVGTLESIRDEVAELLRDVGGLNVRVVGKRVVLSGKVDQTYEEAIGTVQSIYEQVMDLTQKLDPMFYDVLELPSNKMVIMNTKFTEFNKNFIE
jgi:argonaute-like protein implicated in RNA metabolism and viral defense